MSIPYSKCSICQRPFAQDPQPHQHACHFCARTFRRVDVARRHARHCSRRGDQPMPDAKRGRRLRACDACSRAKLSCDSKTPCRRCSSRNLTCTYKWVCDDPSHRLHGVDQQKPTRKPLHLPFLLYLTDPGLKSMTKYVIAQEPGRDLEVPTIWSSMSLNDCMSTDLSSLFFGFTRPNENPSVDHNGVYVDCNEEMPSLMLFNPPDSSISSRLNFLVAELQAMAATNPELEGYFNQFPCAQFFTVSNLQRYLKSFYYKRHYQFPLLHWATFDPEKVSLPLLLVVMLFGASYSLHEEHNISDGYPISLLVGIAEKYIFKNLKTCIWSTSREAISTQHIELCQAALLIFWLNYDSYDENSTERIITKRLPMLIAAIRKLNLVGIRHTSEDSDWQEFIFQESCVRLVTWSWYMTTLAVLFYNYPPLMSISEMTGDFPCSEEVWDITSRSEFDSYKRAVQHSQNPACIDSIVSSLLGEEWTDDMRRSSEKLSIHDLHGVILSLQPVIFNTHTGKLPIDNSTLFIRALDRWDSLWDNAMHCTSIDEVKWLGVSKNGHEISSLSRRIIEVNATVPAAQSRYLQRLPVTSLGVMHEFIREYCYNNKQ